MATTTAPVDDSELNVSVKSKNPKRKEEPNMTTNGDSTPTSIDCVAASGPATNPATTPEPTPTPPPAAPTAPPRPEPPNPFDAASLSLGANYSEGLGVRKVVNTVPNRKPGKSEWFRVRCGDQWRLQTAVLEVEKGVERSTFLVARPLWGDLAEEITPALLLMCLNTTNDLFLWRLKLPGADGRLNTWTESALQIAKAAETSWCRMKSDTANGIYSHRVSTEPLPDPKWPELSFNEIIQLAFRGRMIDTFDHPVIRELRGGA